MSFCMVPENLELHGANAVGPGIGELRPSFSLSKTETNGDLVRLCGFPELSWAEG